MYYLLFFQRLDSVVLFTELVYLVSMDGQSTTVLAAIIIGVIALIIFAIRQTKMENPMLNLKAFKYPLFVLGVIMSFITFFNMLSMLVILPMYMQMALLVAAFTTGLILLPGSLLNCVLAPVIGSLFDKYGPKAVITPGTILVAIGYVFYSQFGTDTAIMDDCGHSYCHDVRYRGGACFCTNKHAKFASENSTIQMESL